MTEPFVPIRKSIRKLIQRHRLTPIEQAVLYCLVMEAGPYTDEVRGTLVYFAELLNLNRRHLTKHFDRLAELGLIEHRFSRSRQGVVKLLCHEAVVHKPSSYGTHRGHTYATERPIRPGPRGNGRDPVRDETSHRKGPNVPYDQDAPISSDVRGPINFHAARDSVSSSLRKADVPLPRDEVA